MRQVYVNIGNYYTKMKIYTKIKSNKIKLYTKMQIYTKINYILK